MEMREFERKKRRILKALNDLDADTCSVIDELRRSFIGSFKDMESFVAIRQSIALARIRIEAREL